MIPSSRLGVAIVALLAAPAGILAQSVTHLTGAGATFPAPIYAKWFANYAHQNPGVAITYDPVGSEAGVRRLLHGDVDFGASDNPQVLRELAPDQESKYLLLPSVIGAVVPIDNLPGFAGDVAFTPGSSSWHFSREDQEMERSGTETGQSGRSSSRS